MLLHISLLVPCVVKSLCRETRSQVYLSPSAHCPNIETPLTSTEHCLIDLLRNDAEEVSSNKFSLIFIFFKRDFLFVADTVLCLRELQESPQTDFSDFLFVAETVSLMCLCELQETVLLFRPYQRLFPHVLRLHWTPGWSGGNCHH